MKQRLLALAAAVSALAGGSVVFFNWESGKPERVVVDVDGWQMLDRDSCSVRLCNAGQCDAARNHLADGGYGATCDPRFVACDWRVSPKMRSCLMDAGVALGTKKYQRVELLALRCLVDGGVAWGVPVDDAGCPIWATSSAAVTPRCVRAPAGNTTCRRLLPDGGSRFFGELNVFPAAEATGTGCEAVGCTVMFGDTDGDL